MSDETERPDPELEARVHDAFAPDSTEPSADSVARLRSLVETARAARTPEPVPMTAHRPRRALMVLAAAVLLVAGAGIGAGLQAALTRDSSDVLARGTAEFDAVLDRGDVEVRIDGAAAPEGRILTLRSDTLPTLAKGEYYQLWFLPDGGSSTGGWISGGTFHPDEAGKTDVVLHAAVDPRLADRVEITRQGAGAPPGPSDDVVVEGTVHLLS